MKNFTPAFFIVLISAMCNPALSTAQTNEQWSGTISYFHSTVSNSNNGKGNTTWTMEVKVDKGKAQTYISEKISYSGHCSQEGLAEGRGEAEFGDISVFDGRFNLEVAMPPTKGTKTTNCNGPQRTEKTGQDDTGLLIENLKAGDDPDILEGDSSSVVTTKHGSETFVVTFRASWSLTRVPVEAELIVTPVSYNEWLPIPGESETSPGNQIMIGLDLRDKNGKASKFKVKYFEAELLETSKLKGVAINYPVQPSANPAFDMAFDDGSRSTTIQKLTIPSDDDRTGSFAISAFDGAATTKLVVYAILQNGKRIKGVLLKPGGPTEVLIPKRKLNSPIGDAWLNSNGNPRDDDDSETSKGNKNNGDGFTAFEEYRGVFSEGKFKRLDPRKKDLGVQIKKAEKNIFDAGIRLLENAADIQIFILYENELESLRQVNKNENTPHPQYALKLFREDKDNNVAGYNEPKDVPNKTPADSWSVRINIQNLTKVYNDQLAAGKIPYTLEENIAVTVAHELGHGIHLDHHGPESKIKPPTKEQIADRSVRILDPNGNPVANAQIDPLTIGEAKNDASGDLGCIMAYTTYYSWWYYIATDKIPVYQSVPLLPIGNRLCTSIKGTGINANGKYFGDATSGNCLGMMKIKDGKK